MTPIHFNPNEPQVLRLKDPSGCLDGFNVLYETADGRLLSLPRPAAVKLNLLDPAPGEEISLTKCRKDREPAEWVVCLTPRAEQARAEREAAADSQHPAPVRQMPTAGKPSSPEPPAPSKGTGTYGPAPQPVPAPRRRPEQICIPFNLAFREVVHFVCVELNASGEQWSEQSRQDLVSTVLIAASKAGYVGVWER